MPKKAQVTRMGMMKIRVMKKKMILLMMLKIQTKWGSKK